MLQQADPGFVFESVVTPKGSELGIMVFSWAGKNRLVACASINLVMISAKPNVSLSFYPTERVIGLVIVVYKLHV